VLSLTAAVAKKRVSLSSTRVFLLGLFVPHQCKHLDVALSGARPILGELVIPAHALLSILHSLSTDYDIALLKPHEEENLAATLVGIPDYELTPAAMIGLFETLSGGDSSSSALAPSNSIGTSGASSASSSSDDFALDADESDAAEFAEERRDTVVETKKKPSLENLFDVRERSSPLPAATLRKRPPRLRGRSETTFTTLSGTDHNVVSCAFLASLVHIDCQMADP